MTNDGLNRLKMIDLIDIFSRKNKQTRLEQNLTVGFPLADGNHGDGLGELRMVRAGGTAGLHGQLTVITLRERWMVNTCA